MKNVTTIIALTITILSFAQTEIKTFVNAHPNVSFIEETVFNQMSASDIALLSADVVVYTKALKLEDIAQFELKNSTVLKNQKVTYALKDENSQFIKDWMGVNADVKIIPNSEYMNSDLQSQTEYTQNENVMVLEGEFITYNDIANF